MCFRYPGLCKVATWNKEIDMPTNEPSYPVSSILLAGKGRCMMLVCRQDLRKFGAIVRAHKLFRYTPRPTQRARSPGPMKIKCILEGV